MANYVLLRRIKLSETTSSITFANIPQTGYTDLKIVVSARTSVSAEQGVLICQPNSATTNLSSTILYGFGNNQGSSNYSVEQSIWSYINGATSTSNGFSSNEIYIPNYNSTSSHKSISVDGLNVNNATNARQSLTAGKWASNTAISSVKLYPGDGSFTASTFLSGSIFSLYGLAATGTTPDTGPKADGGNIISTDGTYWYHAFLSSGFFTPVASLTCDYLVVAGGGGGGYDSAGGGGAGGFRATTSQSLTSTNYLVTVGAGGAGSTNYGVNSNGSDSSFNSFTSAGGGQGGNGGEAGQNGGSGGGATGGGNYTLIGSGNTPSTSPSQGNNGGQGIVGTSGNRPSGGGGGASQVGFNGAGSTAGNGGAGTNTYSTWAAATSTGVSGYYAGGGGGSVGVSGTAGGSGGAGGGGNGGKSGSTSPTAGVANTGGGGGAGSTNTGAAGGSGIVIIRYAV
jgi:hypothetical protein